MVEHKVVWKIDVAQVLGVILVILLIVFGYNQYVVVQEVKDLKTEVQELKDTVVNMEECEQLAYEWAAEMCCGD